MRKLFEIVSPADKVEEAKNALKRRAQRSPKVRQALQKSAETVANWITQGGMWFGDSFDERNAKRLHHIKRWKRKPGQVLVYDTTGKPVRVFEANGNSPVEKEAWALASILWAWNMIESDPLRWGKDRIEFSARAVPGIKQGTRLTKE